jgi:hypothetical protein
MKLHRVLAVAGAAVALAVQAQAGPLPAGVTPTVSLVATSSLGGDVLSITPTPALNADGTYSARGSEVLPSFSLVFNLTLNPDPSLAGSFTLTNLSSSTQFFSVSATLAVLPIAAPTKMGGFYGDVTYTDANNDSSVTLATNGTDPFYRAQIDGVTVQGRGSFNDTAFGGPGAFGTISQDAWGTPIPSATGPGVASSIGVSFPAFSLTPGDRVEVPFEFVVNAPEPSFASLFAMGSTLILLATARRKFYQGN